MAAPFKLAESVLELGANTATGKIPGVDDAGNVLTLEVEGYGNGELWLTDREQIPIVLDRAGAQQLHELLARHLGSLPPGP